MWRRQIRAAHVASLCGVFYAYGGATWSRHMGGPSGPSRFSAPCVERFAIWASKTTTILNCIARGAMWKPWDGGIYLMAPTKDVQQGEYGLVDTTFLIPAVLATGQLSSHLASTQVASATDASGTCSACPTPDEWGGCAAAALTDRLNADHTRELDEQLKESHAAHGRVGSTLNQGCARPVCMRYNCALVAARPRATRVTLGASESPFFSTWGNFNTARARPARFACMQQAFE